MIRSTRRRDATDSIFAALALATLLLCGCGQSQRPRISRARTPAIEPARTTPAPAPVAATTRDADAADRARAGAAAEPLGGARETGRATRIADRAGSGRPAPAPRSAPHGAAPTAQQPTFASSPPRPHDRPDFPPSRGERESLVSLWGDELIESGRDVALPVDASGNIRQISFGTEGSTFDPDIDRTGRRIVYASTRHRTTADIYIQTVGGTSVTQLTADDAHDIMPAFDPTGERIAFASDRSGGWDIYVVDAEGGRPVQLTTDREAELHPSWSPDGRHVAYCRFGAGSGRWEIWVVSVENPSTPSFLTFGLFPQWSPDVATGKILFQRSRERGSHYHSIWTIDWVDGEARRPTEILSAGNAALINPSWSPDGQRIVFITVVDPDAAGDSRPAQSDVWSVKLDGTQRVNLTNGRFANYQPVWAPSGTVYFVSDRSGVDNLWAVTIAGMRETTAATESVANAEPSATMDGQP